MAPGDESVLSTSLPRVSASVPTCRHLVRETLTDWKLPEAVDAAELVVSELASNAVRHARHGEFRLKLQRLDGGRVRVAVIDKSRTLPVMCTAAADDVGGRGLALVDALSHAWGAERLPWGKRVWADVPPGDEPAADSDQSRRFATPTAQIIYVLVLLAIAIWLGVRIAHGQP
ncbi:ATP-binding protein [Streptomyces sp. NPDC051104]|uniref:ATP-binding protein n=1 Tax=Streptomyces sp. NPDC051104 TaxID=3155044 RepID=UPI003446E0FA